MTWLRPLLLVSGELTEEGIKKGITTEPRGSLVMLR